MMKVDYYYDRRIENQIFIILRRLDTLLCCFMSSFSSLNSLIAAELLKLSFRTFYFMSFV